MPNFDEPLIIINGIELTSGQALTIRVAIEGLASDLKENGLGDDQMGKDITEGYLKNISEIRKAIFKAYDVKH